MRDTGKLPMGRGASGLTSVSEGDIWHLLADSQPDADDPFALLSPVGRTPLAEPAVDTLTEPVDVLAQLQHEAQAVLRDPNYVSTHAITGRASAAKSVRTASDPDPFRSLARAGQGKEGLHDMLDGSASIDGLVGPLESPDSPELFAVPHSPDVLRLFAGDIAPNQRQGLIAPLTRREHHLISMDSACRPAHVQESGHDS